jgi:hypothetical protein
VPPILAALARWAGAVSEGDVDASVLNRYFIFQVGGGVVGGGVGSGVVWVR